MELFDKVVTSMRNAKKMEENVKNANNNNGVIKLLLFSSCANKK